MLVINVKEQVALNKSSLLQEIILQNTQTLQLLQQKLYTNFSKTPSWHAWLQIPSGLIKRKRGKVQALKARLQNCLLKVDNAL